MKDFPNTLWRFFLFFLFFSFTKQEDFSSLNAGTTLTYKGNAIDDSFGYSVSTAGDFDNDGYDDMIIGAYGKNNNQGVVYVIYGGPKSSLMDIDFSLMTLNPTTTGFMITGEATQDYFGGSVSSAGDLDNDGYDDIIIAAKNKNSNRGAVYIIYGGPRSSRTDIDLSTTTLDPTTTGFVIKGGAANDYFGSAVASAGDIHNDGYADVVIGALGKNANMGAAYVIYGGPKSTMSHIDLSTTTLNPTSMGFIINGGSSSDYFGSSVSTAGDINQDGYADIIVGAYGRTNSQGAAFVIYGGPKSTRTNIVPVTALNPLTTGFMITGSGAANFFGWSVGSAGDINKDGYADVIIGAYRRNSGQGAAYVVFGGDNVKMKNIALATTDLAQLKIGFMITGNAAGDNLGFSVGGCGDINQDGIQDILIGASAGGKVYVVYGSTSGFSDIDLSSSTSYPTTTGFMIKGDSNNLQFGRSIAFLDINGDGFSDLLIGASGTDASKGAAYLMIYNECPQGCKTCSSTSECTRCFDGFVIENSQCKACPLNCLSCSVPSVCDVCSSGSYLFQGQCLDLCPSSTFPTVDSICISCPLGCTQCTSESNCQACATGFTLSTSKSCIIQSQIPEEKKGEKAAAGTFEGTSLIGAALSSGSSLPLNFGMVAKILRNVKYLNLTVSPELTKTFYSWKVASGFMAAPKSWSLKSESKDLPGVFSRYGLNPVFLINFWKPFIFSLIGLAIFLVFKSVEMVLAKNNDTKTLVHSISKYVNIAASNFALTQFYSNLDDAILYFILEVRSTEFDTAFRIFSTILAVILLMIGGIFVGLHSKLLNNYQALKDQRVQTGSSTQLETFVTKCENIRLIIRDFKDITLLTQSFLLVNLIRSVIASLIIAILFAYPLLQITLLFVLNILMIVYLLAKKPFKELFDTCGQLFCEAILLIANICTFILAVLDHAESYPIDSIKRLSLCIIVLNYILLLGCAVLLVINIGKIFYTTYQERKNIRTVNVSSTMMTESTVKMMNNRSTIMNEKNALETDNQILTYSHRIPINYEAQNMANNEDLNQSNIFSNNVFHSSQFIQDRKQRKMRGSGRDMTNASYDGRGSKVQDYSGVRSQEQTNRMDANLVNLDALTESSRSQWDMPALANFMPKRKMRKNQDILARISK